MPLTTPQDQTIHRRAYHQRLVIFFIVVFAFSVVSVRTEIQNQRLSETNQRIADTQFRECVLRNESASNLNRILDVIISAVKTSPGLTGVERQRRISLYEDAKSRTFDCGTDPTP